MSPSQRPLNLRTLSVLAIVAMLLTVWHHAAGRREAVSLPERVAGAVGRPLQGAFTWLQAGPRKLLRAMVAAPGLVVENERLRQQCAAAEARQTEYMVSCVYYENLLKSLGIPAGRGTPAGRPARVIALDTGPQRYRLTIAVEHGGTIAEGDVVRQAAGLVGRVIKVQGSTAQVLALIDAEAAVAGLDLTSRDQGIVYPLPALAQPSTKLKMEKLKPIAAFPDVRVGDQIISSGLDQVYPAGIPIGRVEQVIKSPGSAASVTAILRPAADFFRLEYVMVMPKGRR